MQKRVKKRSCDLLRKGLICYWSLRDHASMARSNRACLAAWDAMQTKMEENFTYSKCCASCRMSCSVGKQAGPVSTNRDVRHATHPPVKIEPSSDLHQYFPIGIQPPYSTLFLYFSFFWVSFREIPDRKLVCPIEHRFWLSKASGMHREHPFDDFRSSRRLPPATMSLQPSLFVLRTCRYRTMTEKLTR